MINKIWISMILVGITYFLISGEAQALTNLIINFPVSFFYTMLPVMMTLIFWSGLIKVAADAGLIDKFSTKIRWIMVRLFPELPKDSMAHQYISANFLANILGLGSVATPLGLKAFEEMQKINKSDVASNSMITFLLINTSGLTIIPTTILALRGNYNPLMNAELIVYILLATTITTVSAIILNKVVQRL